MGLGTADGMLNVAQQTSPSASPTDQHHQQRGQSVAIEIDRMVFLHT